MNGGFFLNLWEKGLSCVNVEDLDRQLLWDKTFPEETLYTCLSLDKEPKRDQTINTPKVQRGEPMYFIGFLRGICMRGYLQEQK